jgi:WD repeat and SOF domain-containing protein 1
MFIFIGPFLLLSVMDVDYSPTGREFVSAGYDKVIRIYPITKEHSR